MCDRYSYEHGYICNECFEKLVASGKDTDIEAFLQGEEVEDLLAGSREYYNDIFEHCDAEEEY
jgi:hypothetical protein